MNIKKVANQNNNTEFEAGKKYFHSFACDSGAYCEYTVVKRTAKTIWIKGKALDNNVKSFRVAVYDGSEIVYPLGKYSMAPILRATRKA